MRWSKLWPWRTKIDRKAEKRSTCPHLVLAPRWNSAADIGHADRATGYWCAVCELPIGLEGATALQGHPSV